MQKFTHKKLEIQENILSVIKVICKTLIASIALRVRLTVLPERERQGNRVLPATLCSPGLSIPAEEEGKERKQKEHRSEKE